MTSTKGSTAGTGEEVDALKQIPLVDLQADYESNKTDIDDAFQAVCRSGKFIMGPQVSELEAKLTAYLNNDTRSAAVPDVGTVCVSDGTAALQLSLMALGIGHGDEVITTSFTWISSCEVIKLVGAHPVFADVRHSDYSIDTHTVKNLVTPRTRALILVSLFGTVSPDLAALRSAVGPGVKIIEDGAQSFGARDVSGLLSCTSPHVDIATTSFFPTKPLACYGDGGAVFSRDPDLLARVRSMRVHGKAAGGTFEHVGLNSRLDTVQAAILLVKLPAFDSALQKRRQAATTYAKLLAANEHRVILPPVDDDRIGQPAWAVFTVRVRQRDAVLAKLKAANVGCAVYYPTPCHLQPSMAPREGDKELNLRLETTERLAKSVLALPMHPFLTRDVQVRIVNELCTALDDLDVTTKPE